MELRHGIFVLSLLASLRFAVYEFFINLQKMIELINPYCPQFDIVVDVLDGEPFVHPGLLDQILDLKSLVMHLLINRVQVSRLDRSTGVDLFPNPNADSQNLGDI